LDNFLFRFRFHIKLNGNSEQVIILAYSFSGATSSFSCKLVKNFTKTHNYTNNTMKTQSCTPARSIKK